MDRLRRAERFERLAGFRARRRREARGEGEAAGRIGLLIEDKVDSPAALAGDGRMVRARDDDAAKGFRVKGEGERLVRAPRGIECLEKETNNADCECFTTDGDALLIHVCFFLSNMARD